jgi:dihydroorotate dehydrogenase (NAD+) catalytic subunit
MKTPIMTVSLAGLSLANPTMLASGILGYSAEMLKSIANGGAGAVVTKSVGLKPREGYANPTVVQTSSGLINAMGLPNPGINDFMKEIREAKTLLNVPLVVSVFGFSAEQYAEVADKAVEAGADAIELNVSCPHVKDTGSEIGQNPIILGQVIRKVKKPVNKPVIVKLSPNVTNIVEIAEAAKKAGADALTVMNTVKAMAIDVETMTPILANKVGGLSGSAVRPIAVWNVYNVYEEVRIPLIGCGGISDWKDAVEFLLAGASAVQIGTAIATLGRSVFLEVTMGIRAYLKKKKFRSVEEIVGQAHRT